jgi:hypothetical protein
MRTPCKLRLRRALLIGVLALCGVFASVIVAWAVEVRLAYSPGAQLGRKLFFPRQTRCDYADPDHAGQILTQLECADAGYNIYWLARNGLGELPSAGDSGAPPLPSWFLPPGGDEFASGSCAFGIPLRCLKYDVVISHSEDLPPSRDSYRHAISWTLRGGKSNAALPIAPLWPGLLLNTLFYTALFSTPWTLGASRRPLPPPPRPLRNYDLRHDFTKTLPRMRLVPCGGSSSHSNRSERMMPHLFTRRVRERCQGSRGSASAPLVACPCAATP